VALAQTLLAEGRQDSEQSFYIVDLQAIDNTMSTWGEVLPRVHPFYAIKCNPDMGILRVVAEAGGDFDCASPSEIDRVLSLGVSPSRILYANPCKRKKDLRHALAKGVTTVTLDSVFEVDKLAEVCGTQMSALLRVYASDPHAQCLLSTKFGAHPSEWPAILQRFVDTGVPMAGISFHVGSGACTPDAFESAVEEARACIDLARSMGLTPSIIDVGGGFVPATFERIGATLRAALDAHFPSEEGFTLIAEPGRLIAEQCAHLVCPVIGKRIKDEHHQYWIADGLYGSFNCMLYDHAHPPTPILLTATHNHPQISVVAKSKVVGESCDSIDEIHSDIELPILDIGDWLLYPNMGAYTIAGASCFNGIPFYNTPSVYTRLGTPSAFPI
jgi:ornithine decarboxylase